MIERIKRWWWEKQAAKHEVLWQVREGEAVTAWFAANYYRKKLGMPPMRPAVQPDEGQT